MDTCHLLSGQVVVVVVSLTLIVIGPFQKVGLGQKLQFATRRNKTNQIRIRKRELDASNNRSFASEIVSSDYEVTALVGVVVGRCDNSGSSFNWHFSVKPICSNSGALEPAPGEYAVNKQKNNQRC